MINKRSITTIFYILFVAATTIWIVGCEKLTHPIKVIEGSESKKPYTEMLHIYEVNIQIAEVLPARVIIAVTGELPDIGYSHYETTQTREGNTITIKITQFNTLPNDGSVVAPSEIVEYQEQIDIGTFDTGHYTVIVNGATYEFSVN